MPNPIKIPVYEPTPRLTGLVKIAPEAGDILRQLRRQSGLSARYLVSEIIKQGADMVEFIETDGTPH